MRVLGSILALALLTSNGLAQRSRTLANVLNEANIPTAGLSPESLRKAVSNVVSHCDASQYTIAYYTGPEELSSLWIRSYDKQKHRWVSKSFARNSSTNQIDDICFGSIDDVDLIGATWVLRTHINPSAECTIVFSPKLDFRRSIYGWIVDTTRSNLSLIQHSEVHFAPTHPVELSVYDPSHDSLVQVFPPKDDPLRNEFIHYLKDHRDLSWCEQFNSHCDPERFGADLGDVSAGAESDSFAFYITFSPEGYGESASEQREIMYVFRRRGGAWEHRAFPRESAPYSLNDAVNPSNLARIFGENQ